MTAYVISPGVTTGYTLLSGDTLTVLSGGTSDVSAVDAVHEGRRREAEPIVHVLSGGLTWDTVTEQRRRRVRLQRRRGLGDATGLRRRSTYVSSGGVASAASTEGTLTVSSGGAIGGGLVLFGGKAVISGTMAAGQTATFVGTAGVLQLDNLAGFAAKISGLTTSSEKIDLGGFVFSSGGETVTWVRSGTNRDLDRDRRGQGRQPHP